MITTSRDVRIAIAVLAAVAMAGITAADLHEGKQLRAARDFCLGIVCVGAALKSRPTA